MRAVPPALLTGPPAAAPAGPPLPRSVGSLENSVYIYMAIYLVGLLAFYVLYALPMSYIKHYKLDADNTEQLK
jgi:hypothetical protein